MTKKKKANGKSVHHSPAQIQSNALLRFEMASDHLIGPGHFARLSKHVKAQLLENRLNAVRLKFKPGVVHDLDSQKLYQEMFSAYVNERTFVTLEGTDMPVSLFLREGLGLIVGTEGRFDAYNNHEWLAKAVGEVVHFLHKMSILTSDWSKALFSYAPMGLSAYNETDSNNLVWADFTKPESCMVKFDGIAREAIRLCWSDINGDLGYLRLSPCAIGFRSVSPELKYEVYIQRHALQRLEERIGLVTGLVQHAIFELFEGTDFACFRSGPSSLVRFTLWDKKLGYLVCGLYEAKIVIRTFLFLTNDGTPEGKRLSELTQLQRLDKKYLEIDTLSGFLGLKIAEDAVLTALFAEAGCGDLLELATLRKFYLADVKERDPKRLLGYMMGMTG